MTPPNEERRPREEAPPETPTKKSGAILPLDAARLRELASAYVVIVITPQGRARRSVYLSLHSASQAVDRAHNRGQHADMVLCQLVPIGGPR